VATISVIRDEGLLENARTMGEYALARLRSLQERYTCIGDARGLGLMIGIEFVKEGRPDAEGIKKVLASCLKRGLVMIECGVDRNIIRLAPPLVVKKGEIDRGMDILEEALKETGVGVCR